MPGTSIFWERRWFASVANCSRPFARFERAFLFSHEFTLRLKPVVQFLTWTAASCLVNFIGALPDLPGVGDCNFCFESVAVLLA